MPQPPHSRSFATLLWELRVLWLAVLLLLGADLALRPYVFVKKRASTDALVEFAQQPSDAPVILVGSSRFRIVQAEAVQAASGVPLTNLSFNGGTAAAELAMIQGYLTPEVLRQAGTKVLLLGTAPMDMNDSYRNAAVVPLTWNTGTLLGHVLDHGTDNETRSFLFIKPPAAWSSLLQGYLSSKIRGAVRDLALRLTGRLSAPKPSKAPDDGKSAKSSEDDDVLQNRSAVKAKGAKSIENVPPPVSSIYLRNFAVGGRQTEALRSLAGYLRANGVTPVLVHSPVSDWYAEVYLQGEQRAYVTQLKALGAELDVPVFLLPRGAYGLEDADYFRPTRFDGHHIISETGRVKFSSGLGAQIIKPVLAALAARGKAGFELSRFELDGSERAR